MDVKRLVKGATVREYSTNTCTHLRCLQLRCTRMLHHLAPPIRAFAQQFVDGAPAPTRPVTDRRIACK